jgi:hypothetical protein
MKWMLWECYAFPTMQQEFLARKVLERFATRAHARWLDKLPLQAVLGEVAWSTPFTKRASSRKI